MQPARTPGRRATSAAWSSWLLFVQSFSCKKWSGVSGRCNRVQKVEAPYMLLKHPPPPSPPPFSGLCITKTIWIAPTGMQITAVTQPARVNGEGRGEEGRMEFLCHPSPFTPSQMLQDWLTYQSICLVRAKSLCRACRKQRSDGPLEMFLIPRKMESALKFYMVSNSEAEVFKMIFLIKSFYSRDLISLHHHSDQFEY